MVKLDVHVPEKTVEKKKPKLDGCEIIANNSLIFMQSLMNQSRCRVAMRKLKRTPHTEADGGDPQGCCISSF